MLPKLFTAASASQSAPRRAIPLDMRHADALEEALYSSIVGNLYAVDFYEQVGLPMAGSVGDKVPSGYAGFVGIPAEGDERDGAQQRTVVATNVEGAVVYKADAGLTSLDTAQIQGLWVHPDYRGLGLAASLTAAACALLRRRYRHLSLYVNDYNARARALYARLGWEPVGEYATVIFAR